MHSFLLLLVAVVWGSTFVIIKDAGSTVDPFFLVFSRLLIAGGLMAIWCSMTAPSALKSKSAWQYGALLGFLLFCTYGSQTLGLQWTTSGHSGFITGAAVVLVPILMLTLYRIPMALKEVLATLLVLVGLYCLVYDPTVTVNKGDAITVIAAFSYAFHLIFSSKAVKVAPVKGLVTWQFLFASLFAGVAWLIGGGTPFDSLALAWKPMVYLGVVGTLFCYFVSVWAQQFVSPVTVVILFSLEAVFAALFGYLFANELLSLKELLGALLIFGGALGHEVMRAMKR